MARRKSAAPPESPKPKKILHRSRPTVLENGPHAVDLYVGARIRLARSLAGRTQQWLAEQVRLTFQQIQKYERGANRVSCSMLSEFAAALDRPPAWFFQEGEGSESGSVLDLAIGERQRLAYELTSNFARIGNEAARGHIVGLVRSIASREG